MRLQDAEIFNRSKISELENLNSGLKTELGEKDSELKSLRFQLQDFKKKANVGLLEYYEQEVKGLNGKLDALNFQLIQRKQEYDFRVREYQDKLEVCRVREQQQKTFEATRIQAQNFEGKLGDFSCNGDFSKKTESHKLKIIEADSALLVERERFKNLQEMAIADKEKCVQFELKATQLGNFFSFPSNPQFRNGFKLQKYFITGTRAGNPDLGRDRY